MTQLPEYKLSKKPIVLLKLKHEYVKKSKANRPVVCKPVAETWIMNRAEKFTSDKCNSMSVLKPIRIFQITSMLESIETDRRDQQIVWDNKDTTVCL